MTDPLSLLGVAREVPTALALLEGGRSWSYADLAARSATVCENLRSLALPSGAMVALLASNRVETLVVLYALIELGIPFIPIHSRLTEVEVAALIADAEPACVLRDADVDTLVEAAPTLDTVSPPDIASTQLLAMLYTSGTTGKAKGALLTRGAFVASAAASAQNLGWQGTDRWLFCLPMCHIGGLSIVVRCLIARRPIVLVPRFAVADVLRAIERDDATIASVVPTMLKGLMEHDAHNALARLRAIVVGGAACPKGLLEDGARRGLHLLTTYGLTEACSQVTTQAPRAASDVERGSGRALPGVEVWIADDAGTRQPAGVVGRIHVRGPTMMTGYFRLPPLGDEGFDTGDIGWLDDTDCLHVEARLGDLIVTGGENVYPQEVAHCLEAFRGVQSTLVFGVPDATWGERVAIVVAVDDPTTFNEQDFARYAEANLASFKRPRLIAIAGELPHLSNGKLDRRRIIAEWTPTLRAIDQSSLPPTPKKSI